MDPECSLYLCEEFVAQAELTLNSTRQFPANPKISAWEELCGKFDMNATPIVPLGMKFVVRVKPNVRASWASHGELGIYIGREELHYRCHRVRIAK